jgi:cell division protein FtsI (penicillin-binding protein 3)
MDSMTIRQIFAKSSNVGTASLIQQCFGKGKAENYVNQLKKFGLDLVTNIEVGGEEPPIIKNPKDPNSEWSGTTLPWMSIGYELLITPLQLLTFYNAVANDGKMMKPYLVQRTERYGEIYKEFRPSVINNSIAAKSTIKKAKELLTLVVKEGTAENIYTPNYTIAGKTGTTQKNYHKFKYGKGIEYQAGFCGFFPAENPVYSCIVVISEPQRGGYHGAEVAAPVFRAIADKCYAMKSELHPAINDQEATPLAAHRLPSYDAGKTAELRSAMRWLNLSYRPDANLNEWSVIVARDSLGLSLQDRNVSDKYVPSVVGMGLKDAIYLLENRGCKVQVNGIGKVRKQSVNPGTRANGQVCVLYLE